MNVDFDIPDPKRKLYKESWDLFRRASNLQDAVHQLEIESFFMKDEKMKIFYTAAIASLEKDRNETIEFAIERYQQYKNYGI
ncbi:MAG TPA: hypothetical protein VIH27_00830 [Nitrososphaerales archaeon]